MGDGDRDEWDALELSADALSSSASGANSQLPITNYQGTSNSQVPTETGSQSASLLGVGG